VPAKEEKNEKFQDTCFVGLKFHQYSVVPFTFTFRSAVLVTADLKSMDQKSTALCHSAYH